MKIRTQDARQYLEYGEIYAEYSYDGKGATVYARSRFHNGALFAGAYEDMTRAKGKLPGVREGQEKADCNLYYRVLFYCGLWELDRGLYHWLPMEG